MTPLPAPSNNYAPIQKWLHWLVVLIVAGQVPVGIMMAQRAAANVFDDVTNRLYSGHKLMGFVLLLLMVARLIVKRRLGAPPPVATLTPFERIASASVHHLLYVLLILAPLVGWAAVSAYPAREIFGLFSLPPILPVNQPLAERLFGIHRVLALLTLVLVLFHIAGALMHGVIKQDGVMNRMIGWWPLRR